MNQSPLSILETMQTNQEAIRAKQASENRANFPELAKIMDELKKTGPVKLIHAINFETGVTLGRSSTP